MEEQETPTDEDEGWNDLPVLVLEKVYMYLNPRHRYNASITCRAWNEAFYTPRIWQDFYMADTTLTTRKREFYKRNEKELSRSRLRGCLSATGCFIKHIYVMPMFDYYSLFGFLAVLKRFIEIGGVDYPLPQLDTFSFSFACQSWGLSGSVVHGTGGKILQGLEDLLQTLKGLKSLTLNQLLLTKEDALGVLEGALDNSGNTLEYLEVMNCTKQFHPLFQVAFFHNLKRLVLSPQNLNDDVVLMLAQTHLSELYVTQDVYTDIDEVIPVSGDSWHEAACMSPELQVRLSAIGGSHSEIVFQPHAPVFSVIYNTAYSTVTSDSIMTICGNYSKTINMYGHLGLPKTHGSRSFDDRGDASLYYLVRNCPKIDTLAIRERISTSTLLLIVEAARNLKRLYVRQNAILKKSDWPKNPTWSDVYYDKLKKNALSYELMEKEVSMCLGYPWKPISDKVYQNLCI